MARPWRRRRDWWDGVGWRDEFGRGRRPLYRQFETLPNGADGQQQPSQHGFRRCSAARYRRCSMRSAAQGHFSVVRNSARRPLGSFPICYSCFFHPQKFDCRIHHQITRWTQTDNDSVVSRASLDWDNYESERLRTEVDLLDMEHHRLTNAEDEGVEGMTTGLSSTTLLMVSHGSNDTTLQASRISNRSASSPYVLCFECSEDFSVNDERRGGDNSSYFAPRHTSSSPRPPRRTRRSPPTPPAQPNLMDPSPTSRDHLNPDGQQDGRSSKAVKPRRK